MTNKSLLLIVKILLLSTRQKNDWKERKGYIGKKDRGGGMEMWMLQGMLPELRRETNDGAMN